MKHVTMYAFGVIAIFASACNITGMSHKPVRQDKQIAGGGDATGNPIEGKPIDDPTNSSMQPGASEASNLPGGTPSLPPSEPASPCFREPTPSKLLVVAHESGSAHARIFETTDGGQTKAQVHNSIQFEEQFRGGGSVALGDLNGDKIPDIVVGAGWLGGPRIQIIDGCNGSIIANFFAFDSTWRTGVNVAVGDLDGDGTAELIAAAGRKDAHSLGNSAVAIFKMNAGANGGATPWVTEFAPFPGTTGGASIVAGDFDGDGKKELAVGAGPGGGPVVKIYKCVTGSCTPSQGDQFVFDAAIRTGINLGSGRINADTKDDLIVSIGGAGGGPRVRVLDGADSASVLHDFFAYESEVTTGLFVAAVDWNQDGTDDIIVGPMEGGGPRVRIFNGKDRNVLLNEFLYQQTDKRFGSVVAGTR